jgi:hypothetical protein
LVLSPESHKSFGIAIAYFSKSLKKLMVLDGFES